MEKNKNGLVDNVICNSAKNGLMPQRDFFDKDIANTENTNGYYIIQENDFVYNPRKSNEAPYGPISMYKYKDKGIVSPLYLCFRATKEIHPRYFEMYFKSSVWHKYIYFAGDSGARYDRVSIKDDVFFEMPINIPSLPEQQKIADFLSLVDRRIEKQRQLVESLKKYKRGLFLKLYNDSEKKSYKICDLGKYCATGALSKDDIDVSGKYPCILYGELFTKYGEVIKQVVSRTNVIPTYLSGTNEILFPSSTTADAQSLIFPSSLKIKNISLGGDLFTIKLKNEFDSDFISYVVNFEYKNTLARYAQGITIIHLYYTDIKEQVIDIPNVDTQFNISGVMRKIETIIEMNINKLNSLLLMKKSFLQKMFI